MIVRYIHIHTCIRSYIHPIRMYTHTNIHYKQTNIHTLGLHSFGYVLNRKMKRSVVLRRLQPAKGAMPFLRCLGFSEQGINAAYMYVCVCMYVCMYMCMCVCMHTDELLVLPTALTNTVLLSKCLQSLNCIEELRIKYQEEKLRKVQRRNASLISKRRKREDGFRGTYSYMCIDIRTWYWNTYIYILMNIQSHCQTYMRTHLTMTYTIHIYAHIH